MLLMLARGDSDKRTVRERTASKSKGLNLKREHCVFSARVLGIYNAHNGYHRSPFVPSHSQALVLSSLSKPVHPI